MFYFSSKKFSGHVADMVSHKKIKKCSIFPQSSVSLL